MTLCGGKYGEKNNVINIFNTFSTSGFMVFHIFGRVYAEVIHIFSTNVNKCANYRFIKIWINIFHMIFTGEKNDYDTKIKKCIC